MNTTKMIRVRVKPTMMVRYIRAGSTVELEGPHMIGIVFIT